MDTVSNNEESSEIQSPTTVQLDSEFEELIYLTGLKIDGEVTRHIISLLRNGVRPINIYMMLQNLAKKYKEPVEIVKEEQAMHVKETADMTKVYEVDGKSVQHKAKSIIEFASKNTLLFDISPPRKTETNMK